MKTDNGPARIQGGLWFKERLKRGILALGLVLVTTAGATNFVSVKGGQWFDASTWKPAAVPLSGDNVTISSNYIVYLTFTNALYLQVSNLDLSSGTLNLSDVSGQGLLAMSGTNSSWNNSNFGSVAPGGAALQLGTLELAGNNAIGATFTNQGVMRQTDAGTLNINESALVNAPGGTCEFAGDGDMTARNGNLGDFYNEGLLLKSSGVNTSSIAAPFHNQGGTIEVDSGTLVTSQAINCSNGTFIVGSNGTLDLTGGGSAQWAGAITGGGAGQVVLRSGSLNGNPVVSLDFSNDLFQWTGGGMGGTVTNLGVITLSGSNTVTSPGLLVNAGLFRQTNSAALRLYNTTVENLPGATYDLEGDGNFASGGFGVGGYFHNFGLFRKSGGDGVSSFGNSAFANYGGMLEVDRGTVGVSYLFVQTNGVTWLNGGNLSGSTLNFNGGVLTGFGSVTGAVVNVGAIVLPGTNGLGALDIVGAYQQHGGGALDIMLGGTNAGDFSQLDVSGGASLAGSLNLSLTNGYAPAVGDQFQILSCSSRSGAFSLTNEFPTGIAVNYSNTGAFLVVTGAVVWPVRLAAAQIAGSDLDFSLQTVANQSYTIQRNDDLATTNWVDYSNFTGDGGLKNFVMPITNVPQRFFRARDP